MNQMYTKAFHVKIPHDNGTLAIRIRKDMDEYLIENDITFLMSYDHEFIHSYGRFFIYEFYNKEDALMFKLKYG